MSKNSDFISMQKYSALKIQWINIFKIQSLSRAQTGLPMEIPIHAVLHTSDQFCRALHSASFLSLSTYVDVGGPLSRCPCVGSQSTSLLAEVLGVTQPWQPPIQMLVGNMLVLVDVQSYTQRKQCCQCCSIHPETAGG